MVEKKHKFHMPWGTITLSAVIVALIIIFAKGWLAQWAALLPFADAKTYLYPLVIIFITVIVAKIAATILHRYFQRASGRLRVIDRTRYALFAKLTTVIIYVIGFGVAGSFIPALRALSVSLFASAGILAIVIGFATQKTLGNLVSGMMIAIDQPYRIGDNILFDGEYGTVADITLRQTVIKTWDNRRIIVPNSKMDESVINNFTIEDSKILGWFEIGISYDSDINLARTIMVDEARKHPDYLDNRTQSEIETGTPDVRVRVVETADSAIMLRLYFWARNQPTNFAMKCDLRESIKKRFDKEGVEIPFPYLTLVRKKDLAAPKRIRKKRKK